MSAKVSHRFVRQFAADKLSRPKNIVLPALDARPLFFEIGAGKGKHALLFASEHADKRLIAAERTSEKFAAFAKAVRTKAGVAEQDAAIASLENLDAVHADAMAFAVHFLPPASLDGVFILYPNPEPHNKNQRWLNMPFFEFLISRLKAGAPIVLASNIAEYIDEAENLLNQTWLLPYQKQQISANSARTHFEVKYLARGEMCQQLVMFKPNYYRTRFDEFDGTKGDASCDDERAHE
ncbi:SAM-dependent methyltransferase [Moraxella caviae]|nr:SAM-dependent methyltransferase [Moraxella caviae]OOR90130.1 SAM-dependent methyltransferase [Moraxella caviae]